MLVIHNAVTQQKLCFVSTDRACILHIMQLSVLEPLASL